MLFLELFAQSTVLQLLPSKFIIRRIPSPRKPRTFWAESECSTGRPAEVRALFVTNRDQSVLVPGLWPHRKSVAYTV